jgi:predicted nucleotidyltransferase
VQAYRYDVCIKLVGGCYADENSINTGEKKVMSDREQTIEALNSTRQYLCDHYGIISMLLFGSFARNEQKEDSDVDVFVDTLAPNPFTLMEAKEYLTKVVKRPVDVIRNHRNLNPRLKRRIERDGIRVF